MRFITRRILEMILATSASKFENEGVEFACLLRADGDTVTELILPPGTIGSASSALLRLHMMPIDFSVVGSAHSHPTPNASPSDDDLRFFSQTGSVHLIVAYPFDARSWRAYSRDGSEMRLEVV